MFAPSRYSSYITDGSKITATMSDDNSGEPRASAFLRTYNLVPAFRFKPNTGPIALGNIIADPQRPHRALTTVDAATLQSHKYPCLETDAQRDRKVSHVRKYEVSGGVWSRLFHTDDRNSVGTYIMDELEKIYFNDAELTLQEVQARLSSPHVEEILKPGRVSFTRQPVYMVTGMVIAKGIRAKETRGSSSLTGERIIKESWRTEEDVVFAYRLLKIELKGLTGGRVVYGGFQLDKATWGILVDEDMHESSMGIVTNGESQEDEGHGDGTEPQVGRSYD